MTPRERFLRTVNFEKPDDRLPMIEWAAWWHLTFQRWQEEGLPKDISWEGSLDYFGLDKLMCVGAGGGPVGLPEGASRVVSDEKSYDALRPYLFSDRTIEGAVAHAKSIKERHDRGEFVLRVWLDGYFWFPRGLFGIAEHMIAFYDQPELMHRITADLADFNARALEAIFAEITPDMVGLAEDMSYNHGPMLSRETFNEFLLPHYLRIAPIMRKHKVKFLVDTDGQVMPMIPWLLEAGVEGVYPLERQAGVDILEIRKKYPRFIMMGGYDKMVMPKGEREMRAEFDRLLPVMKSGGFIPSVDHQTPPGVSLDNYRIYIRLFEEYTRKALA